MSLFLLTNRNKRGDYELGHLLLLKKGELSHINVFNPRNQINRPYK